MSRGEDLGRIVGYRQNTAEQLLCFHLAAMLSDLLLLEERARLVCNILPAPETDEPGKLAVALQEASQAARWLLDRARSRLFADGAASSRPILPPGAAASLCPRCAGTYGTHAPDCDRDRPPPIYSPLSAAPRKRRAPR